MGPRERVLAPSCGKDEHLPCRPNSENCCSKNVAPGKALSPEPGMPREVNKWSSPRERNGSQRGARTGPKPHLIQREQRWDESKQQAAESRRSYPSFPLECKSTPSKCVCRGRERGGRGSHIRGDKRSPGMTRGTRNCSHQPLPSLELPRASLGGEPSPGTWAPVSLKPSNMAMERPWETPFPNPTSSSPSLQHISHSRQRRPDPTAEKPLNENPKTKSERRAAPEESPMLRERPQAPLATCEE